MTDQITPDYIEIEEKALKGFNRLYELQNPPPIAPNTTKSIPLQERLVIGALAVIMLASIIVSAAHTIPMFTSTVNFAGNWQKLEYLVGISTLIMVEMAMIVFSYFRIKVNPKEVETSEIKNKALAAIGIAAIIATSANVYSVFDNFYFSASDTLEETTPISDTSRPVSFSEVSTVKDTNPIMDGAKIAISVLIGFGAPLQAFVAGDILGVLLVMVQSQASRDYKTYEQRLAGWNIARDEKWNNVKASYILKVKKDLSVDRSPDIRYLPVNSFVNSERTNERTNSEQITSNITNTNAGFTRNRNAKKVALDYFEANPNQVNLPLSKLAPIISEWANQPVKETSIHEARTIYRQNNQTSVE